MNASRKSRIARRVAFVLISSVPVLLAANDDPSSTQSTPPPIPTPCIRYWQIGPQRVWFNPDQTKVTALDTGYISPQFATNNDGQALSFFIADGKVYNSSSSSPLDLTPFLGNKVPNASNMPVVEIPESKTVYVFLGYAPEPDRLESPRAFFVAFDSDLLRSGDVGKSMKGLFPLDIGSNENANCGTIHLAAVASDAAHKDSATVFVSTCRHVYGFRVTETPTAFDRSRFFHDEIPYEAAKSNTHHRAEMEVAPTNDGYLVLWPFVTNAGTMGIAGTKLRTNEDIVDIIFSKKKTLYLGSEPMPLPFLKGLEIAADWRTFYVTWPGDPTQLLEFPLLDASGNWSDLNSFTWQYGAFTGGGGIGASQIQTGADGRFYMMQDDRLIAFSLGQMAKEYFLPPGISGHTTDSPSWPDESIRLLPATTLGSFNACNEPPIGAGTTGGIFDPGSSSSSSSSGAGGAGSTGSSSSSNGSSSGWSNDSSGAGGSGGSVFICNLGPPGPAANYAECYQCTDQGAGAYAHECSVEYAACLADEFCSFFLGWAYAPEMSVDAASAQILVDNACPDGDDNRLPGFCKFQQLEMCAACGACRNVCPETEGYCNTLMVKPACP